MPYPHSIRLRGLWEYEPLERDGGAPLPLLGRVEVPCDWGASLGPDFRGRVRYTRHFNRPGTLEAAERLWLVVEAVDARGEVWLNGNSIGSIGASAQPFECDITRWLESHNQLQLIVECRVDDPDRPPHRRAFAGGPIGAVRLEVRLAAE